MTRGLLTIVVLFGTLTATRYSATAGSAGTITDLGTLGRDPRTRPWKKGGAMSIFRVISATAFAVVCLLVTSTEAEIIRPPSAGVFAYAQFYCYGEVCEYWPPLPTGTVVVTPFGYTWGPNDRGPSWSPDASRIAYSWDGEIVVMDAAGFSVNIITHSAAFEAWPAWSPDGRRIAFVSDAEGQPGLYLMNPDGSSVVRVTTNVGVSDGSRPAWSPDSARLIFGCEIAAGNQDICAINADGSGFLQLTDDPAYDAEPAWSPDGRTIVFVSNRWSANWELAMMRPDGSGITRLGGGVIGGGPAWSPDGSLIAFTATNWDFEFGVAVYTVDTDGSRVRLVVGNATDPAWVPSFAGLSVSFGIYCSDSTLTCSFDASSSVGSITDFAWSFGDGTTGSGELVSHTYLDGGDLSIELRVTDTRGRTASHVESIHLNRRPVASLTVSCHKFSTCVFDATASYDPDGPIRGVKWTFGDGTGSGCGGNCPLTTSHTYAAPGTYTATVEITDDFYLAATVSRTVIVGRIRRNP
jgi:hypothetical protein